MTTAEKIARLSDGQLKKALGRTYDAMARLVPEIDRGFDRFAIGEKSAALLLADDRLFAEYCRRKGWIPNPWDQLSA